MKEEKYEEARKIIEKKNIKDTVTTSKIQQQIAKLFKEIGLNVEKEFLIGPYVLDFALKKKKVKSIYNNIYIIIYIYIYIIYLFIFLNPSKNRFINSYNHDIFFYKIVTEIKKSKKKTKQTKRTKKIIK